MAASETRAARVSRVGEYAGYSQPEYDGWVRSSRFVEARDGTRLAVDVLRPTRNGVVEEEPLPVAWTSKRYIRAFVHDGKLTTIADVPHPNARPAMDSPAARKLIAHGYVLAAADMRGAGASFGTRSDTSPPSDATDGYDVNEWLAAQPWCDGNVGMFGASYEGRMQLAAASEAPPHLKAILPEIPPFDWYGIIHQGGIYTPRFVTRGSSFRGCDLNPAVAPVDEDVDGSLVAEARRVHEEGNDYGATLGELPFRDSLNAAGVRQWLERSGEALLAGVVRSGVATYGRSGWFTRQRLDHLLWFSNLARSSTGDRHRIMMGPWSTSGPSADDRELWAVETLRFLDYWLKGIDNGIMDEPPFVYVTQASTKDRTVGTWRYADGWPLPEAELRELVFAAGPSGSVASVNDGRLAESSTPAEAGSDELTVDFAIEAPPWDTDGPGDGAGESFVAYDEQCLTYTTAPLEADLEVVGHPVIRLHVSSTADDGDFVVHLEDVDESGVSTFVTNKVQRASHRAVTPAHFYNFDSPWHSCNESDQLPIPAGEVVELAFDLLPVCYVFRAGHRLRITVAGADPHLIETPVLDPPPVVSVHRGGAHPSRITLPVIAGTD